MSFLTAMSSTGAALVALSLAVARGDDETRSDVRAGFPIRVTLENGGAALDRLLASEFWRTLETNPAWTAAWKKKEARQGLMALRFLAGALKTDLHGLFRSVLAREVTILVAPEYATGAGDSGGPGRMLVAVDLGDPDTAMRWFEVLDQALALVAVGEGAILEGTIRSANGKEFHAMSGSRVLASNDRATLEAALVEADDPTRNDDELPATASQGSPSLRFALDLARLRELGAKRAPEIHENGVGALLVHGVNVAANRATRLAGEFFLGDDGVHGIARLDHPAIDDEALAWFFAARGQAPPDVWPEGTIASFRLDRRFAEFYRAHEAWLDEASANGFVQFDNGMNLFFGGRSFADEVLPALCDAALVLVTPQVYAELPAPPEVKIPAFTLLTCFDRSKLKEREFATAFQQAVAIISLDRANKGQESMLSAAERIGKTTVYAACFPPPDDEEDGDGESTDAGSAPSMQPGAAMTAGVGSSSEMRFNASPALAVKGDRLLLGSSKDGVVGLLTALDAVPPAAEASPARTALAIDLHALERILAANRESLVANRMLEEGESRDEAETAIDLFLLALRAGRKFETALTLGEGGLALSTAWTFDAGSATGSRH